MSQLRLSFPAGRARFSDVAVTASNRSAVTMLASAREWHGNILCVIGPPACGLAYLLRAWTEANGAMEVRAEDFDRLDTAGVEAFASRPGAIRRADKVMRADRLLMTLNLFQSNGRRLLLSARSSPSSWPVPPGDLASRLRAIPTTEILPPDDDMVLKRLQAGCRARFIRLEDETARYVAMRLERSYAAIEDYVRRLDAAISDTGRAPSIHLARTVLEEGTGTRALFGDD